MGDAPRISVIVPCYNVERWLPRCLDETLQALPADAELIAVNDASEDASLAILLARAKSDSRIHVIDSAHGGVSAARNRGLDVARGKYVFFIDPDDGVEPDFFTVMVETLERDGADCCICGYGERDDGSDVCDSKIYLKGDYRFHANAEIVLNYLPRIFGYSFADVRAWYAGASLFANREMAGVWRMVYRRDLIESRHVRFDVDLVLYEDAMFNVEYLLGANSMTCVNRPIYRATRRETGAMHMVPRHGERYCRNKLRLIRKRAELDQLAGGALAPVYAGTCVFSALEMLFYVARRRVGLRPGFRLLGELLDEQPVRMALADVPLAWRRRTIMAVTVVFLRFLVCCRRTLKLVYYHT